MVPSGNTLDHLGTLGFPGALFGAPHSQSFPEVEKRAPQCGPESYRAPREAKRAPKVPQGLPDGAPEVEKYNQEDGK